MVWISIHILERIANIRKAQSNSNLKALAMLPTTMTGLVFTVWSKKEFAVLNVTSNGAPSLLGGASGLE